VQHRQKIVFFALPRVAARTAGGGDCAMMGCSRRFAGQWSLLLFSALTPQDGRPGMTVRGMPDQWQMRTFLNVENAVGADHYPRLPERNDVRGRRATVTPDLETVTIVNTTEEVMWSRSNREACGWACPRP